MTRAAVITGLGAWTPARMVTNAELASYLDTSDEWIRTRTGIRQRYLVGPGEACSDLAVEAGRRALDSAGTRTADMVVVATTTADRPCPAVAPEVASRLGLGTVAALDVSAVCSGFLYALATAAGFIAAHVADSVLVIGSDAFSTVVNPADRASRVLFGDGAGAVLLRAGSAEEQGALLAFDLGSDGARSDLLQIPGGGSRQRSTGLPVKDEDSYFQMAGGTVFALAVQRMSETVRRSLDRTDWAIEQVDRFVLHQANARILSAVAQRLDVVPEKFLSNIDRVGNTAAASIALALADGVSSGQLRAGQRTVLAAFGGGLTWAAVTLIWPEIALE